MRPALGDVPPFRIVAKPFVAPVPGGTAALPSATGDSAAARYTARMDDLAGASTTRSAGSGATAANIPALAGITTTLMTLEPDVISEPHWHPAADEVCIIMRTLA